MNAFDRGGGTRDPGRSFFILEELLTMRRSLAVLTLAVAAFGASALTNAAVGRPTARVAADSPIEHVVFIDEENHSFNDLFGKYCVEQAEGRIRRAGLNDGCIGSSEAMLHNGNTYQLTR